MARVGYGAGKRCAILFEISIASAAVLRHKIFDLRGFWRRYGEDGIPFSAARHGAGAFSRAATADSHELGSQGNQRRLGPADAKEIVVSAPAYRRLRVKTGGLKTGEPRNDEDPRREVRSKFAEVFRRVVDLVLYIPVVAYFLYWDRKESLRRSLRVGALSVLSLSLLSLWAEVAAEIAGAPAIVRLIERYELRWPSVIVFSAAVLFLLFHHSRERRHERPHHFLGEKVWEFYENRPYSSETELVDTALRLFHEVFRAFGVAHVSIFRLEGEFLKIHGREVYPEEADRGYFEPIPIGRGVAGLVQKDLNPRYVPRLFFPWNRQSWLSLFFPHSMKFEIEDNETGSLTLVNPTMDLFVFQPPQQGNIRFRAFLSVPLKCTLTETEHRCLGVLNFDFETTDPLSKIDIKSAVFLGALLGEEMYRFHNVAKQ
jgi:hypothetical protein